MALVATPTSVAGRPPVLLLLLGLLVLLGALVASGQRALVYERYLGRDQVGRYAGSQWAGSRWPKKPWRGNIRTGQHTRHDLTNEVLNLEAEIEEGALSRNKNLTAGYSPQRKAVLAMMQQIFARPPGDEEMRGWRNIRWGLGEQALILTRKLPATSIVDTKRVVTMPALPDCLAQMVNKRWEHYSDDTFPWGCCYMDIFHMIERCHGKGDTVTTTTTTKPDGGSTERAWRSTKRPKPKSTSTTTTTTTKPDGGSTERAWRSTKRPKPKSTTTRPARVTTSAGSKARKATNATTTSTSTPPPSSAPADK